MRTAAAEGGAAAAANAVDLPAMVVGNITGTFGETSVIALLIGAIYLLAKKVISIRIPATYILTFAVFMLSLIHIFFSDYSLVHMARI